MTDYSYIRTPRMNMKSSIFAEFVKKIKELEEENAQLKEEVSKESYKVSEAYCLVEELKELLKELRISVMFDKDLVAKIDEVLK